MSAPVIFLDLGQVLAVHRRMVDEFGGDTGLRDRGLLESALAMPAARMAGRYLHRGLPSMAAAYLFHLCRNHAFIDGNKRTALAAAELFLLLNDRTLSATNDELYALTMGLAAGTISKAETTRFFRKHVAP